MVAQISKSVKQVQVIARIQYKNNAKAVVYLVRSSNGIDQYKTTIYNGKATACTCPGGHGRCYHKIQLEAKETVRAAISVAIARREYQKQQVTPAATLAGYDVVGASLKVVNQAMIDAKIGTFYEDIVTGLGSCDTCGYSVKPGFPTCGKCLGC